MTMQELGYFKIYEYIFPTYRLWIVNTNKSERWTISA